MALVPGQGGVRELAKLTHEPLAPFVAEKWINASRHPSLPLTIYNYGAKTQFAKHWTPETMACRGLILDDADRVVARPFSKFFNIGEQPDVRPAGTWNAYEKLDGSLFIVARYGDEIVTATRGSFTGRQAELGRALLLAKPTEWIRKDRTYLFELLHPENRIVVDYGDRADLVLLAVRQTCNGDELSPDDDDAFRGLDGIPFPINRPMSFWALTDALTNPESRANREGIVIHFTDAGTRLKFKFDDYVRLHRLLTGISSCAIWEMLRDGKPLDELLENVPDEFYGWVRETVAALHREHDVINTAAWADFDELKQLRSDRRAFAEAANKRDTKHLLFALLDGKPIEPLIWKQIKPARALPFRVDEAA